MKNLIRVFDDGAQMFRVEPDGPCTTADGVHEFAPEMGAMFGANGNCCANCGAFSGVEVEEAHAR